MTSKIVYQGGLRTEATHIPSSKTLITDAPVDNRGQGASFSPTDMVATALASCILTIMGIKAEDKGWDMTGAYAETTKTMSSSGARRISKIEIHVYMPQKDYSEEAKKMLEKAAHGCPVRRSLHPELEEKLKIHWM